MDKPRDIPDDIWNAAGRAVNMQNFAATPQLIYPVAQAILAERDRCARIAFCAYDRKTEISSRILRKIRTGVEQ